MIQVSIKYAIITLNIVHGIGTLTIASVAVFSLFRLLIEYRGSFQMFPAWALREKYLTERGVYYRNLMLRFAIYFVLWRLGGDILLAVLRSLSPDAP